MSRPSGAGYDVVVEVDDEGDLGHTDLETGLDFQDFGHNDVPAGKIPSDQSRGFFSGGASSSRQDNTTAAGQPAGKRYLWTLSFYAQFFNVDTPEVLRRCWAALFPKSNFLDVLEGNPDLYGPVWIASTVVLMLFLTSTLAEYFAKVHGEDGERFKYNFKSLTGAAGLVYGYTAFVPLGLWGVLKWYGSDSANLLECLSLYGYANVVWVPVSIASVSPVQILNWVFCAVGLTISAMFLSRNLYPVISGIEAQTSKIVLGVMLALHGGFALAIKILFFAHASGKPL
ncbi:hypothetical protein Dda_7836 [Drechslerella dactyloides]|uniref:Protein YIP n=1 Tax=Drechslerella dactyloides TaxID=74499 RepID=A0AAD6IQY6_DREDA|nr:hypothetical protein Dda_7836 [Drechslerella dactyloides]